jgi:SAM-dependent methyltransferase
MVVIAAARAAAKRAYAQLVQQSRVAAYLGGEPSPRLNIGCGYNTLPGWLNVDLTAGRGPTVYMDATRRFPLPDNTFAAVLCEHMIEHIPVEAGAALVREVFRVLAPGGWFRVVTPDLENLAGLCLASPSPEARRYLDFVADLHGRPTITPAEALNYIFYEYGHRHIYSISNLAQVLRGAGFVDVADTRAGYPIQAVFHGVEGHPGFMGLENDALEAFALEGRKPSLAGSGAQAEEAGQGASTSAAYPARAAAATRG